MTRPNIILLMTDQQRWDSLGLQRQQICFYTKRRSVSGWWCELHQQFHPVARLYPCTRYYVDRRLSTPASGDLQLLQHG